MRALPKLFFLGMFVLTACHVQETDPLVSFRVYCEMVANGAKPVAFSDPLESSEVEEHWGNYLAIAEEYSVSLYREDDLPSTLLFPGDITTGKSIIIIYIADRLTQYEQWKADHLALSEEQTEKQMASARRLGRLLGYTTLGINKLLSKNTDFRTLAEFGVEQQVTHLYYKNPDEASEFYATVLGLSALENDRFQIGEDVFIQLNSLNREHPEDQPKSTAIALLTDQLPAWYAHIQENKVPVKYTYKPREGGPHDGFVAIDPGGYLLEFEQFKQHPENEPFKAILSGAKRIITAIDDLEFYGSITWTYHRDLLKMQQFYEETLGYQLVADQGWTKIYQTTSSGFIGLVDECRGMEDYAEEKAVELEWEISDFGEFDIYGRNHWSNYQSASAIITGPEKYRYRLTD